MPCTQCKEGKYKWGETGDCKYDSKEDCESANHKYNKMRPTPLGKTYEEYAKELKEFNLSKVEKIELGAIDDFDKLFKQALGDNTAEKLIDNLRKAEVGFEKGLKDFQKALKEGDTIKVLAKDLGIDIPKEVINKIDSMAQYIKDYNKYISKVKSMYNIF